MEGENATSILEEEINELLEMLKKLQKKPGAKDLDCKKGSNFDKQASLFEKKLQRFRGISDEEEICIKEIQEMAEATLSSSHVDGGFVSNRNNNVEILRRKMEGLSKGELLKKMVEEYGSMLSTSGASSASSSKRMENSDMSMVSMRQLYKEAMSSCSGSCKAIVRRILEEVRAETEQWSQMQEMLGEVSDEIEELQASRDFWEDRALDSGNQIQSLQSVVNEWKRKVVSSEKN